MSYCELCENHFHNYDLHVYLVHKNGVEYRCRYCGMYFEDAEPLFDHIVALHTSGDFKCHFCSLKTKNLDSHLDQHAELFLYSCRCGHKFSSKSTFIKHECHRCIFCLEYVWDYKHYGSFSCCDSFFACETFFNKHRVDCDKRFCIPCGEFQSKNHFLFESCCDETILCYTQYLSHIESHLQCHHCNFHSKNKKSLRIHIKHTHSHEYRCFYCTFVCKRKNTIANHLRYRTCCGLEFNCWSSFNYHRCEKLCCRWCGKTFKAKFHLKEHIRRHKTLIERLSCKFCSKTFSNKRELKYHTARHEGLLDNVCHCGKAFVTNSKLKEHQAIHDKENLICDKCFKQCKTKSILNAHQKTHEMMYSCFHCGKRFARKPTSHIQEVECCGLYFRCHTEFLEHEKRVKHELNCEFCFRKYKSRRALLHHKSRNHYEKTTLLNGEYSCDVCFRFFSSVHNLARHKRRNHIKDK